MVYTEEETPVEDAPVVVVVVSKWLQSGQMVCVSVMVMMSVVSEVQVSLEVVMVV